MTAGIYLPRILKIGGGARHDLVSVLGELGLARPLIITDAYIADCGFLQELQEDLAGIHHGVFKDCVPDPTTASVNAGLAVWEQGDFDSLVAIGGGSSIDTAKAISVLAAHGGEIASYKVPAQVAQGIPVIAIPTTAGTGAEATRAAVITDTSSDEKMLCFGIGMLPVAALVDYELTLSMPRRLTADTGIDTLCHALEAYVSKKANSFADAYALSALSAVASHLRVVCEEPDNHQSREAMMLAATQGGMAFSNSSVTLIHGMSRPLGAHFHIPHGMSNAMLLPVVTEFSISGAKARYADCESAMGLGQGQLVDWLYQLCADLEVPTPELFGVGYEAYHDLIDTMCTQAIASGSPANNPIVPSADELAALYRQIY